MNLHLGLVVDTKHLFNAYAHAAPCCICCDYDHVQSYLPDSPSIRLTLAILLQPDDICISISKQARVTLTRKPARPCYIDVVHQMGSSSLSLQEPWPLPAITIAKPWGNELWYTGIEARGICKAGGIPLPWLLDVFPEHILGMDVAPEPILLKILDPLPSASFGDLYFELHQKKIEVYVVTHIDKRAWPDGQGKIRYGFNQALLGAAASEEQFKSDYLKAVNDYRDIRYRIDKLLDRQKKRAGLDANAPASATQIAQWSRALEPALVAAEEDKKHLMYRYTQLDPIKLGDVIRVNPFVPHALQHGVRVIEFQTAHYERHILSFTQKVLAQKQWDTAAALQIANIRARLNRSLAVEVRSDNCLVEVVADFQQFKAIRVTLLADIKNTTPEYTLAIDSYALVIGVSGKSRVNGTKIFPESAVFIASHQNNLRLTSISDQAIVLVAVPKKQPGRLQA